MIREGQQKSKKISNGQRSFKLVNGHLGSLTVIGLIGVDFDFRSSNSQKEKTLKS